MKFLFTKPGTTNLMADNGPLLQFISNTWDDFGYKTQFGVILHTDSNLYELGTVNIAYVDSNEYERMPDTQLITMDWLEQHDLVNSQLEKFPNNLLCLGNADYYGKLVELYSGTIELDALLAATNDIVRNSQLYVQYSDNPVFNASFFRFASEDILSEFGGILDGQAPRKAFDWTLTYTSDNCNQVLQLRNDLGSALPTNMFALIGNNGVGKTSILKDLLVSAAKYKSKLTDSRFIEGATFAFSQDDTDLEDNLINSITSLLYITYSSFDVFDDEFVQTLQENHNFQFLSNRSATRNNQITHKNINSFENALDVSYQIETDLEWIYYDTSAAKLFGKAMQAFSWDYELTTIASEIERTSYTADIEGLRSKTQDQVVKLSSGQKMILSMLINIVRSSSNNALILIDEPELYLHPPYALALILSINTILEETASCCLITTHSSVTVQEIPKSNISIITTSSGNKSIQPPRIETYGTDTATINNEIFGVDIRNTGFYETLSGLDNMNPGELTRLVNEGKLGREALAFVSILRRHHV